MPRKNRSKKGGTNAHLLREESLSWNQPCKNHNACGTNTTGMQVVRMGDAHNTIIFCETQEQVQPAVAKMTEYLDNRIPNLLRGKATMY